MRSQRVKTLARECGFELCGITAAAPSPQARYYRQWVEAGMAGEMRYLTDRRAQVRDDPRRLLPTARSLICAGKLYDTPQPYSTELGEPELAWISRYAWGGDYHDVLRAGLQRLADRLRQEAGQPFDYKICVDTAPLLERAYAEQAGLGWIAKNTCLINQQMGSWFFLGELLVSLDLEPDQPPPDRCGSCTRCIDACPTQAILPGGRALDARLCISYFTIELRGAAPAGQRAAVGNHVFGCDVCQDVCPWNRRRVFSEEPAFAARHFAPPLDALAALTAEEFHALFRHTPVERARYSGFLRNVAIAMGNSRAAKFRAPLEKLAQSPDPLVAEHARWALGQLE
ncbi:MAG: tRNA epoxyqueuosine(34) reductase QueG [Candidatus Solibacter usitatus]|nr:tRNA epoxyqueuosine(34) reductase QueG [Candidatus Solibacter usitatus]